MNWDRTPSPEDFTAGRATNGTPRDRVKVPNRKADGTPAPRFRQHPGGTVVYSRTAAA